MIPISARCRTWDRFIFVDLLPKITTPLEVSFVNVEVVGVGEATQQGWGERNEIGSILDGQLRLN